MQRYTYKLLKFSEVDGQYRGANRSDDELEQRVNQQLNQLATEGWEVHNFSTHYVGGRVIYTVLIKHETEANAPVPAPIEKFSPAAIVADPTKPPTNTNGIPPAAEITKRPLLQRRDFDSTMQLRPVEEGPTVGERAAEIRRTVEATNGAEYFQKALVAFDSSLKIRVGQEKVPAEAIALRALKYRDKKNEVTFQFALCWLSEHGYANRPLASILSEGSETGHVLAELDDAAKTRLLNVNPSGSQPSVQDRMASRFDLPEHTQAGHQKPPARFNR